MGFFNFSYNWFIIFTFHLSNQYNYYYSLRKLRKCYLRKLISIDNTASCPYTNLQGVTSVVPCDAILPSKGIEQKTSRRLGQRCKRRPQSSHEPQGRFQTHELSMSPLIFVHIRLRFQYFWALYLWFHNVGRVPQKCRIFNPCILGHLDQFLYQGQFCNFACIK